MYLLPLISTSNNFVASKCHLRNFKASKMIMQLKVVVYNSIFSFLIFNARCTKTLPSPLMIFLMVFNGNIFGTILLTNVHQCSR